MTAPTVPDMPAVRAPVQPATQLRSSGPRLLRIAPSGEPSTFVTWVRDQVGAGPPVSEKVQALEKELVSALREKDPARALTVASVIVYESPTHDVARRIKERCAQHLRGKTRAFPQLDAIPRMRIPWHELGGRNLSQRAAYMLSCIDGYSTVEVLVDVSAMSPLEAYDTLDLLVRDGIVELT